MGECIHFVGLLSKIEIIYVLYPAPRGCSITDSYYYIIIIIIIIIIITTTSWSPCHQTLPSPCTYTHTPVDRTNALPTCLHLLDSPQFRLPKPPWAPAETLPFTRLTAQLSFHLLEPTTLSARTYLKMLTWLSISRGRSTVRQAHSQMLPFHLLQ